jgi:hypothetical protein
MRAPLFLRLRRGKAISYPFLTILLAAWSRPKLCVDSVHFFSEWRFLVDLRPVFFRFALAIYKIDVLPNLSRLAIYPE